jgi:hypothetical protein
MIELNDKIHNTNIYKFRMLKFVLLILQIYLLIDLLQAT